jgi:hypothetical protein
MNRRTLKKIILISFLFLVFLQPISSADESLHTVWAIKDCRIIPVAGKLIEKGTVVIRDGLIEAVGPNQQIPPDAEVIEGTGLTVYPGMIDALTDSLLKIPGMKMDRSKIYSGKYTDRDRGFTPDMKAFDYVDLSKTAMSKYHKAGITTAHLLPQDGIFTGQGTLLSLSDKGKNNSVILKDTWLGIGFSTSRFPTYPTSLMGVIAFLRQQFTDVAYYSMHRSAWQRNQKGIKRPEFNSLYDTMSPFVNGDREIVFLCRNHYDISRSIKLGKKFGLKYVICDLGGEAFRVIPELKRAGAKVLITLGYKLPSTSIYTQIGKYKREMAEKEIYPKNAVKLSEAGIPFAFSSLGTGDPSKFISAVRIAIESGLSEKDALAAITSKAADILGVNGSLGSVTRGRIANIIVADGDLFNKDTKIKHVFVDGIKFDTKKKKEAGEKPTVNVTGRWELTITGGMGAMKFTAELNQEESSLSGKVVMQFGSSEFEDGIVSGNDISADFTFSMGGREIDIYLAATVEGDTMSGTLVFGTHGSTEFTGKRIP